MWGFMTLHLIHETCNTSLDTMFLCSLDVDENLLGQLTTFHAVFNLCSTPSTWDSTIQARQYLRKHLIQIVKAISISDWGSKFIRAPTGRIYFWQPVK